jgi:hypothetical protein
MLQMHIMPSSVQLEESGILPTMGMLLRREVRSRSKRAFHQRMLVMQSRMPREIELCLTVKPVGPMPMKKHFEPLERCNLDLALFLVMA